MEKLHNLKSRICSFQNLLGAYHDAAKQKRYRDEVLQFSWNLEENLQSIMDDLLSMTYTVGAYREFYVRYPKPRLVMALGFRDRVVQWAIYRQINPYVDKRFITHSYGCRKNKGTLAAAQCLLNWVQLISRKPDAQDWVILKGDISKYFYRIDHKIALDVYADITDDEWFLWLMGVIINNPDVPFGLPEGMNADDCPRSKRLYDVGTPIGNLTSQETANIYLDRLDRHCKHVLGIRYYVRYMDDFIILMRGRDAAKETFSKIEGFLRDNLRLSISPKSKILPVMQSVEFVGYKISPHGLRLRSKTAHHIKRACNHVAEFHAQGIIDLDSALQTIHSYLGMTKHCNAHYLRRWIEDNIAFQRREQPMKLPDANAPPDRGRRFYAIEPQDDGTVDVYLAPIACVYDTDMGVREYDISMRVVRGVIPWPEIEDDIRARYDAWCESAEVIDL